MAKNSNGTGVLLLIGIAVLASIPKEVWEVLLAVSTAALVVYFINKIDKSTLSLPPKVASKVNRTDDCLSANFSLSHPSVSATAAQEFSGTKGRWIKPDESVEVAGITIPGGMIYVGSSLPTQQGGVDPSLIIPSLPASSRQFNLQERLMGYWPSYSTINEFARGAYLQWLASGRCSTDANIGYVFLFFYGLERRVIVDADYDDEACAEIPIIAEEVRRLLSIYSNRSFQTYAGNFLDLLNARMGRGVEEIKATTGRATMRLALKIRLGQLVDASKPIPADMALAWARSEPSVIVPRAALHCPVNEFNKMFEMNYRARYGEGMVLPVSRTKLKMSYRPASSAFSGRDIIIPLPEMTDVTALASPIKKLQDIVNETAEQWQPFSKLNRKGTQRANSQYSALLKPKALWPQELQTSVQTISERIGTGLLKTNFGDVAEMLGVKGPVTRDSIDAIKACLHALDISIEPDALTGGKFTKESEPIILFKLDPDRSYDSATGAYPVAAITMDLASTIMMADGHASASEMRLLMGHIEDWTGLTNGQKKRLTARMRLGMESPPSLSTLKKKLELVPTAGRRAIAHLLSTLAQVDGEPTIEEVRQLEKIYKALGLATQEAYDDLHAAPTKTKPKAKTQDAALVTGTKPNTPRGMYLDSDRVAALQKETEQVSAMLAAVFAEQNEKQSSDSAEKTADLAPVADAALIGLDLEHTAFLRLILTRSSWSRKELTDAAADMELMLDGALERINEAALDNFGEPLIEGEDPVEISATVMEKVMS